MKMTHTIMIAAAVFVAVFIAVMWMEGWRLTSVEEPAPGHRAIQRIQGTAKC